MGPVPPPKNQPSTFPRIDTRHTYKYLPEYHDTDHEKRLENPPTRMMKEGPKQGPPLLFKVQGMIKHPHVLHEELAWDFLDE